MSKSLVNNSIYNIFYKLLNVLFPLITATYISRVLLVEGVGKVSYAQNIVSYFTLLAALGLPSYGTREIAKLKGKNKDILFSELYTINFVSTIVFTIAYVLLINNVKMFSEQIRLYYICGLTLVLNIFNIDWFYQGEEEYGYIAVRSFFVKCISVACIFIFVRDSADYWKYALITVVGTAGNYLFNVYHIRKRIHFTLKGLKVKRHIAPLLILLSSGIAIELYTAIDTTMLGVMCTETEVGYYTNAVKLIKIIQSVISAIGAILLPRLSYLYSYGEKDKFAELVNRVLKVMMVIVLPATVGLVCVSDILIPVLFGSSFGGSIGTIRILALTLPILVINVLFGIQVLIPSGREKQYLMTVCLGAGINLCFNPFFIMHYKQYGAAIASLISESVVGLSTLFFARKIVSIKLNWKYCFSIIISNIFMVLAIIVVKNMKFAKFVELVLSVTMGSVIYFTFLILLKNEAGIDIFQVMLKKAQHVLKK